MAKATLILIVPVLPSIGASGQACQSWTDRFSVATTTQALARQSPPPIERPDACTVKVETVVPADGEPRVMTVQRLRVVISNRDNLSDDCKEWEDDYNANVACKSDG